MSEVRNADQRGRDLMVVEIAAKQLALAIVRYSEGVASGSSGSSGAGSHENGQNGLSHADSAAASRHKPDDGPDDAAASAADGDTQ